MRQGAVTTLSFDINIKRIRRAHDRSIAQGRCTNRDLAPNVEGNEPFAFLYKRLILHICGTAVGNFFFRWLKQKAHRHGQFVFHGRKDLSRAKEDRNMRIMAAGMHSPFFFRGIRGSGFFLDGKGIDIGTDANDMV